MTLRCYVSYTHYLTTAILLYKDKDRQTETMTVCFSESISGNCFDIFTITVGTVHTNFTKEIPILS